jgi:hypothetical protein
VVGTGLPFMEFGLRRSRPVMKYPATLAGSWRLPLILLVSWMSLSATTRAAISVGNSGVQIGGFFSQGWLYSSNNNYPTADKGGTWDSREMAFNASTAVGSHVRIGGQAFAQRLGNLGEDQVILDWAVADYNVRPEFGIRIGRVKYPKGLYGEALDLDVVRPFVFLPGSVYSPILRDFSASFNGGMLYGSISAGKHSLDYKVFYGDIPMTRQKGVAEFYNNAGLYSPSAGGVSQLNMDSVAGGQLAWNTPVSGLKFVYSYSYYSNLSTDGAFVAYPAANLHSNIDRFSWNTLSLEYARDSWTFAGEWQRTGGGLVYSAPPVLGRVSDNVGWDGWYVSAARRLNDKFEIGSYYSRLESRYASASTAAAQKHQTDYALSLRYDLSEHVLFKIEGHYIEGTYQTFNTVRIPNPSATRQNTTTVIAVKTTFSF